MTKKSTKKAIAKKTVAKKKVVRKTTKKTTKKRSTVKKDGTKKVGRPLKLNETWLETAQEFLNSGMNAIIYTNEEMLFAINEKVPQKYQLGNRTFKRYISGDLKELTKTEQVLYDKFRHILKSALLKQKNHLFANMAVAETARQRFAWIIERKFKDWNLKHISEVSGVDGQPLIPNAVIKIVKNK